MSTIAVVQTGGKQYLVRKGDIITVEKLEAKEGETISLEPLLVADDSGSDSKVGAPTVKGAMVSASVAGHGRADKVTVIKFKPKVRYKRKAGHRQPFTSLKIEEIKA